MGSETDREIKLYFSHCLGTNKQGRRATENRDVLLGFPDGTMRSLVIWEQPRLGVGQNLTFFSDLCPITIRKRGEWKFLTSRLIQMRIYYKWGYSFKLLIDYKERIVLIKSTSQAKKFEAELSKEDADVEILNPSAEDLETKAHRRYSAVYRIRTEQQ